MKKTSHKLKLSTVSEILTTVTNTKTVRETVTAPGRLSRRGNCVQYEVLEHKKGHWGDDEMQTECADDSAVRSPQGSRRPDTPQRRGCQQQGKNRARAARGLGPTAATFL